jgi:hypothetical protein
MKRNTKERRDEIRAAAAAILDEQQVDVEQRVVYRPLALLLVQRTGCSKPTAERHIMREVRRRRGELAKAPGWGGARPNSGPKPNPDTARITVSARFTADEVYEIDAVRGDDSRTSFVRKAVLAEDKIKELRDERHRMF